MWSWLCSQMARKFELRTVFGVSLLLAERISFDLMRTSRAQTHIQIRSLGGANSEKRKVKANSPTSDRTFLEKFSAERNWTKSGRGIPSQLCCALCLLAAHKQQAGELARYARRRRRTELASRAASLDSRDGGRANKTVVPNSPIERTGRARLGRTREPKPKPKHWLIVERSSPAIRLSSTATPKTLAKSNVGSLSRVVVIFYSLSAIAERTSS